jgi:RsiW-degrading membrane proteinase PrsW (M82 family)
MSSPHPITVGPSTYQQHPRQKQRDVLLPVLGLVGLAICGLLVYSMLILALGPVEVLVSTVLALLVIPLVVAAFLWLDRWEPEPPRLLLGAFLWGAGFAVLAAGALNMIGGATLCAGSEPCVAVIVAPIVEETLKGCFLLGLFLFRRREFDGVLDGIVYAGLVGAGFTFVEDIEYLAGSLATGGTEGLLVTFVVRELGTPFAHPLFTAMTGIGLGIAVNARHMPVRIAAPVAGFALAVLLHAAFNGSFTLLAESNLGGLALLFAFVLIFIFAVAVVLYQRRREQRIIAAELPGMAQAGWIAPSEVALLQCLARRRSWRRDVRRLAGPTVAKAVTEYQAVVTELAILRHRMKRGSLGPRGAEWHDQLLHDVHVARRKANKAPDALEAYWGRRPPPPNWTPPPPSAQPGQTPIR